MVAKEFLSKTGGPVRYSLGPALSRLAELESHGRRLVTAEAQLRGLRTGLRAATLTYCERRAGDVAVRLRINPDRPEVVERPQTVTMHPYSTVTSLVFQAFWPEETRREYQQRYPLWEHGAHLWRTLEALTRELGIVRKRGYAWAVKEANTLVLSAPVFGPGQDIVGALGVRTLIEPRDATAARTDLAARVVEAAKVVSGGSAETKTQQRKRG
jgi:DNA-binding IclR family transcriptional regulator